VAILGLLVLALSISGFSGSQEELPIEMEWDGEVYTQTYGILTDEDLANMNVTRTGDKSEVLIPQDKTGEIYVYNGRNYVIYMSAAAIESMMEYGEPSVEMSGEVGPLEVIKSEGTRLISCIEIQSAVNAAYRVMGYWGDADLMRGPFDTKLGIRNAFSGTVTHWYNIGHGGSNVLQFQDADMYSNEFRGLPGIRGCRIVLNSCYTYNGDLKTVITGEEPNFFIAGRIGLPIGPSEEVSADFWYYYSVKGMNEIDALNAAVSENSGSSGWFGLWT
jgi:hypothetical protein